MASNYYQITTEFFDKMDSEMEVLKKKKKTALIVYASISGACLLSFILSMVINVDFLLLVFVILLIAALIALSVSKKFEKQIKAFISDSECNFYDQVFANIVANELGGTIESHSYKNTAFKKSDAVPGLTLSSREVVLSGVVNGNNFIYTQSKADVITDVITETKTDSVISYSHFETKSDVSLGFTTRKEATSSISLLPMAEKEKYGRREKIRMDDKNFRFHVECDDELFAYKFLTADVMEGLQSWRERSNLNRIDLSDDTCCATYPFIVKGIDLDYNPKFSKKMEVNREKYNSDAIYTEVLKSVSNIRALMEDVPQCII